jgi:AraC-like DNA-binding protein
MSSLVARNYLVSVRGRRCRVERFAPSPELASVISHFWLARWDLRGQPPFLFENLPSPNVFALTNASDANVHGIVTGKYSRLLEGRGRSFGVTFRPGAFYPFLKAPVSTIRNATVPIRDVFNVDFERVGRDAVRDGNSQRAIQRVEALIFDMFPTRNEAVLCASAMVDHVRTHGDVHRVSQLASVFGVKLRTLERIFDRYVGVSAKWTIKYYRLLSAAERIASATFDRWPALAAELGYFDQAHFINDFQSVIGASPAEFAKRFTSP